MGSMDQYKSINIDAGRRAMALAHEKWGRQQPLNQAFADLVSDPNRQCNTVGQWYVVSIEHQQANLAKGEVAGRGMVAYLPLVPQRERHGRGSWRTVWRPMMGLYMFVRCAPPQWGLVTSSRGVRRFLGNDGIPQWFGNDRLEVIRLIEAEKAEEERERAARETAVAKAKAGGRSGIVWHFGEGDCVRIKNGPFTGFYADLTAAVDVHDRIKVLVNCFGRRSLVELSAFEIAKAL